MSKFIGEAADETQRRVAVIGDFVEFAIKGALAGAERKLGAKLNAYEVVDAIVSSLAAILPGGYGVLKPDVLTAVEVVRPLPRPGDWR